ncbi:LOW QUALITY PROTEIN: hypothetical protein ElyMa_001598400 [Elysia marginata]|uniref:SRCR domain-containing protein n=1 Tax=Elysia marginata TaxID=1093978 RepID=A0AAV4JIE6_9GAST|nr:LOW QUALITY PROTEIN: hypothetical protein ElyMa_001598400 [Elysia marginata]
MYTLWYSSDSEVIVEVLVVVVVVVVVVVSSSSSSSGGGGGGGGYATQNSITITVGYQRLSQHSRWFPQYDETWLANTSSLCPDGIDLEGAILNVVVCQGGQLDESCNHTGKAQEWEPNKRSENLTEIA